MSVWTPQQWEELYRSNDIRTLEEYGFAGVRSTRVEVQEKPEALASLDDAIGAFWQRFSAARPTVRDDAKLATRGLADISLDDGCLMVRAFPTSYAAVRFKNSRSEEENTKLTDAQRSFLDDQFLTLGAGAYLTCDKGYLLGKRAKHVARAGIIENVPLGLADPAGWKNRNEDLLYQTLARELQEETGLEMDKDIAGYFPTHLNLGPKYGDCTLLYHLQPTPKAVSKVRANPEEHEEVFWRSAGDITRMMRSGERYSLNPCTVALFDDLISLP